MRNWTAVMASALLLACSGCPNTCAYLFSEGVGVPCDAQEACPEGTYCAADGTCQAGVAQDAGSPQDAAGADQVGVDRATPDVIGADAASADLVASDGSADLDAITFDGAAADASGADGAPGDASNADGAAIADAASTDAAPADSASTDLVASDSALADSAVFDAGVPVDAALPDAALPDLLVEDGGEDAGGAPDAGTSDAAPAADAATGEDVVEGEDTGDFPDAYTGEDTYAGEDTGGYPDAYVGEDASGDEDAGEPNIAFLTHDLYGMSTLGPLGAADAICQTAGDTIAGSSNTYRAWLSDPVGGVDARDRLGSARGWVRVDGRPFVDTVADLSSGKIYYPLRVEETGFENSSANVATGTSADGTAGFVCGRWDNSSAMSTTGFTGATTGIWTENAQYLCSNTSRIYCFGVDRQHPVQPVSAGLPIAFVSTQTFSPPGSGTAAADAICNGEGQAQYPGRSFKALLCEEGVAAQTRLNNIPSSWERPDGVKVADSATAFLGNNHITAPLNVNVDGTAYLGDVHVWTGCPEGFDLPGTQQSTCNDWSGNSGSGVSGRANFTTTARYGLTSDSCGTGSLPLYCVED